MRNELEIIEQIEQYAMGVMNSSDRTNFEAQIASDSELQSNIQFQQNLVEGIQRMGLKASTQNAYKSYLLRKWIILVSALIGIVAFVSVVAINYTSDLSSVEMNDSEAQGVSQIQEINKEDVPVVSEVIGMEIDSNDTVLTSQNPLANSFDPVPGAHDSYRDEVPRPSNRPSHIVLDKNDPIYADANEMLDQELFEIQTNRDTVIESEDGIVVFIPADAFDTNIDQVDFIVQGAVKPEDIMYAGLNTMTDKGDTLETGGMFYLDAFANGKRIGLLKDLTIDIPSNPFKTGMQLYDGEKDEAGQIVWKNPKDLKKPLTAAEITDLDFYPPGYEAKMNEWGYLNKEFIDSLYYSFGFNRRSFEYELEGFEMDRPSGRDYRYFSKKRSKSTVEKLMSDPDIVAGSILKSNNNEFYFDSYKKKQRRFKSNNDENAPISYDSINKDYLNPNELDEYWGPSVNRYINWYISAKKVEGNLVDIIFNVKQTNACYIYSTQKEDSYNMPTQFLFQEVEGDFELVGNVREFGIATYEKEKNYDVESIVKYSPTDRVQFVQRIEMKNVVASLQINYAYMPCVGGGRTLPPKEDSVLIHISIDSMLDNCGVKPTAVRTIWNKSFNNTNLATIEFEERMPWIHKTCNTEILELYVDNLDKDLSIVDQMAADLLNGELKTKFAAFADLDMGRIELKTTAQISLNEYYKTKQKALEEAVEFANANYWKEQDSLDQVGNKRNVQANQLVAANKELLLKKEIDFNTEMVYAALRMKKDPPRTNRLVSFGNNDQAGISSPSTQVNPSRSVLRANISRLGWSNIDCLFSVSRMRANTEIRRNGRLASINYSGWSGQVNNADNYERVNVYIVPKAFNSFVKLSSVGGNYNYRLNDEISYRTIAIAWNDDGMFFYQNNNTRKGTDKMKLQKISKDEWENKIKSSLASINTMSEELDYLEFTKKDEKRQNKVNAKRDLNRRARPYVFPCANDVESVENIGLESDVVNDSVREDVDDQNSDQNQDDKKRLEIKAPGTFSPDGDGINDYYFFKNTDVYKDFSVYFKDKKGKKVFTSTDQHFKWDGTDEKGKLVPAGLYKGLVYAVDQDNRAYEVYIEVRVVRSNK